MSTGVFCAHKPYFLMLGHIFWMNSTSEKGATSMRESVNLVPKSNTNIPTHNKGAP